MGSSIGPLVPSNNPDAAVDNCPRCEEFERVRDDLGHQKHMRAHLSAEMDRWVRKAMDLEAERDRLRSFAESLAREDFRGNRPHYITEARRVLGEETP